MKISTHTLLKNAFFLSTILLSGCFLVACGSQDASSDASSSIKDPFKEALEAQNSTSPTDSSVSAGSAGSAGRSGSTSIVVSPNGFAVGSGTAKGNLQPSNPAPNNSNAITPTPGQDPFKAYLDAHPPKPNH